MDILSLNFVIDNHLPSPTSIAQIFINQISFGQFGNLVRHSWGTVETQLGHNIENSRAQLRQSWGKDGAQLRLDHRKKIVIS